MSDPFSEGKPAPAPEPAPAVTPAPAAPAPVPTSLEPPAPKVFPAPVFAPEPEDVAAAQRQVEHEKEYAAQDARVAALTASAPAEAGAIADYDYSLPTTQVVPATKGKKPGAMFLEDGVWKPLKIFGGKEKTSAEREAFAEIMARADDLRLRLEQVLASKAFLLAQVADAEEMEAAIRKAQAGLAEEAQKRLMEVLTG